MSRSFLAICIAVMAFFVPAMALADGPATRPTVKVAVLPFDVIGEAGHEWIGRAMQDGLVNGLTEQGGIGPIAVAGVGPFNSSSATDAGKSANADYAIFGSIQMVVDEMRVTGQIVSISSGQSIGNLRGDGGERDLFAIEDSLAQRAARIIAPSPKVTVAVAAASFDLVGPTLSPYKTPRYFDGDLTSILHPPQRYRDQYDQYYYYSGWYGWGYPYFGYCWGNYWYGYGYWGGWTLPFGTPWFFPRGYAVSGW